MSRRSNDDYRGKEKEEPVCVDHGMWCVLMRNELTGAVGLPHCFRLSEWSGLAQMILFN